MPNQKINKGNIKNMLELFDVKILWTPRFAAVSTTIFNPLSTCDKMKYHKFRELLLEIYDTDHSA